MLVPTNICLSSTLLSDFVAFFQYMLCYLISECIQFMYLIVHIIRMFIQFSTLYCFRCTFFFLSNCVKTHSSGHVPVKIHLFMYILLVLPVEIGFCTDSCTDSFILAHQGLDYSRWECRIFGYQHFVSDMSLPVHEGFGCQPLPVCLKLQLENMAVHSWACILSTVQEVSVGLLELSLLLRRAM